MYFYSLSVFPGAHLVSVFGSERPNAIDMKYDELEPYVVIELNTQWKINNNV